MDARGSRGALVFTEITAMLSGPAIIPCAVSCSFQIVIHS